MSGNLFQIPVKRGSDMGTDMMGFVGVSMNTKKPSSLLALVLSSLCAHSEI